MIIPKPNKIELLNEECLITNLYESKQIDVFEQADASLPSEGYALKISSEGISLTYKDEAGKEHGESTINQLVKLYPSKIPAMLIEDCPRIPMRVYMMDVARYFFPVEEIKRQIDYIALYKFNTLHLHLNDDQGWRVQIKAYPLLTQIGSKRRRTLLRFKEHQGYYTQDQLRDIVSYAHGKGIKVIPEIDMPGHFQAALASYPELGCFNRKVKVAENFGVKFDVACPAKESTYGFIKTVIDELSEIFTDEYFHIGGDEVPSHRWELCQDCQRKYLELGCKNYAEYQAHLMNEIGKYVISKGKQVIMWNESIPTGLIDERIIWECWDIDFKSESFQREIARGRKIINAKTEPYYLDLPYGINSLKDVYEYEPMAFEGNTIGASMSLWTELIPSVKVARKKAFPRLLAGAERMWSNEKDYLNFVSRLDKQKDILKAFGVKAVPNYKCNPKGIVKALSKLWWARRVLYWAGLANIITNKKIENKYRG